MTIGAKYLRTAPDGRKKFVTIATQTEREYHASLKETGYSYVQISEAPGVCLSCEG